MVGAELLTDWRNPGGEVYADVIAGAYPFYGGLVQIVDAVAAAAKNETTVVNKTTAFNETNGD